MKMAHPKTVRKHSEKLKLIGIVEHLVRTLDRPVCSADVRAFCRQHPDAAPLYLQRTGQCLIKAARSMPEPIPYLKKVGVVGNQAYYAMELNPAIEAALRLHKDRLRAAEGASWRIADHACNLIDTEWDYVARQACAGFAQEFGLLAILDINLSAQIKNAELWVNDIFLPSRSPDLISALEAKHIIRSAAALALGVERSQHINYARILSDWKWPQSNLFPQIGEGKSHEKNQLILVCQLKWPEVTNHIPQSLAACSRYKPNITIRITTASK